MILKNIFKGITLAIYLIVSILPIATINLTVANAATDPCAITTFWKDPSGKDWGILPSKPKVGMQYSMVGQFKNCNGKGQAQIVMTRPNGTKQTSPQKTVNAEYVDIVQGVTFSSVGKYSFDAQIVDASGNVVKTAAGNPLSSPGYPTEVLAASDGNDGNTAPPPPDGNTTPPPPTDGNDGNETSLGSSEVLESPIDVTSLGELIVRLIRYLLIFVGALSVLFVIIGGLKMVTSAGNEKAVTSGKQTVQWAIVGLVVCLMAFTIVSIIQGLLGRQ